MYICLGLVSPKSVKCIRFLFGNKHCTVLFTKSKCYWLFTSELQQKTPIFKKNIRKWISFKYIWNLNKQTECSVNSINIFMALAILIMMLKKDCIPCTLYKHTPINTQQLYYLTLCQKGNFVNILQYASKYI